jgi:hypothetical protein
MRYTDLSGFSHHPSEIAGQGGLGEAEVSTQIFEWNKTLKADVDCGESETTEMVRGWLT